MNVNDSNTKSDPISGACLECQTGHPVDVYPDGTRLHVHSGFAAPCTAATPMSDTGPVLSAPSMEDVIHELRAALSYARKRISDLGDQKARLQGLYAGALNRIQELEDERNALREGLEECIESFRLIIVNRVGECGRCDGRCEGCSECVAQKALAAAQALLGKGDANHDSGKKA